MHEVLDECASTVKFVKLHACGVHIVLLLSGKIISFPDRFFSVFICGGGIKRVSWISVGYL